MQVSTYIDHTLLKPTSTREEIEKLCGEAASYHFAAVCVPPPFVQLAKQLLEQTSVKTATVIGFPFGYSAKEAKIAECGQALADGADELDMVINLISVRAGAWGLVEEEIEAITFLVHAKNKTIKVIIESGILSDDEIVKCCEIGSRRGVDFLKTSTGYAEKGASVHAVQLMRLHLPGHIQIKASGGIRTYEFAQQLIAAGATRIGASSSIAIVAGGMPLQ